MIFRVNVQWFQGLSLMISRMKLGWISGWKLNDFQGESSTTCRRSQVGLNHPCHWFVSNKNTKCHIDAHWNHHYRKDLRIVKNSIWRKVGSSCLLLSGNTSARFTGLTGDMVHGRLELALQTTSSNIIIMVGSIFLLSENYYLKHYQIQQQQNLIQLLPGFQYLGNVIILCIRKQFGFCNMFITPGTSLF